MTHPMVTQLRFARSEFVRCLQGLSAEDARIQLGQMNCISWIVGHLAAHENQVFVYLAQDKVIQPGLRKTVGYGSPPSAPKLDDMWAAWREVTAQADVYLDTVTTESLQEHFHWKGKPLEESIGTMLYRAIYHYWFHLGEAHAIRQMLGHGDLPQFVGRLHDAPYAPA